MADLTPFMCSEARRIGLGYALDRCRWWCHLLIRRPRTESPRDAEARCGRTETVSSTHE